MNPQLSATRRVALTVALAAVTAAGLTGCGSPSTTTDTPAASTTAAVLTLENGWVKAVEELTSGTGPSATMPPSGAGHAATPMTGMFGTLHNGTDVTVTVTGGSSPVAGTVQLHETVKNSAGTMQMQQKDGGFVIPAGGDLVLEPGGDHVMLMDLTRALPTGTQVEVTLQTSAGDVMLTVPVRTFTGAQESYVPSPSAS